MNRKLIRDLAAQALGIRTAEYRYANDLDTFKLAVEAIGYPCVVKPLMSSSGKGQSVLRSENEIETVWNFAIYGSRGDLLEVIVESFVDFHTEITLLTLTQDGGPTLFCPAIGHRQERGDYQESWQPCIIPKKDVEEAQRMAASVTEALGGAGIWGVEFFIADDGVYFSELSPRPHDTGMVTLAHTQNLSEFELHARAILGLPIKEIRLERAGVSAVILAEDEGTSRPVYSGVAEALEDPYMDVRIFGKPSTRPYRRMGVVLKQGPLSADMKDLRASAAGAASKISVSVLSSAVVG